jgi:putative redox protein
MTTHATVTWQGAVCFEAGADSGHSVTIDGPAEAGGDGRGFRPMELMLLGLGGCMALDVLTILRRMHQSITSYRLNLSAERADQPPRVYTEVTIEHVLAGDCVTDDAVQRAICLAESKYCSGSAMFAKTARIKNLYRIVRT